MATLRCENVVSNFYVHVFPSWKLVHLLQGNPCVDRLFTVDEVQGAFVTSKLYRIINEQRHSTWRVQLVSTKKETCLAKSPIVAENTKKIGAHDGTFTATRLLPTKNNCRNTKRRKSSDVLSCYLCYPVIYVCFSCFITFVITRP